MLHTFTNNLRSRGGEYWSVNPDPVKEWAITTANGAKAYWGQAFTVEDTNFVSCDLSNFRRSFASRYLKRTSRFQYRWNKFGDKEFCVFINIKDGVKPMSEKEFQIHH